MRVEKYRKAALEYTIIQKKAFRAVEEMDYAILIHYLNFPLCMAIFRIVFILKVLS